MLNAISRRRGAVASATAALFSDRTARRAARRSSHGAELPRALGRSREQRRQRVARDRARRDRRGVVAARAHDLGTDRVARGRCAAPEAARAAGIAVGRASDRARDDRRRARSPASPRPTSCRGTSTRSRPGSAPAPGFLGISVALLGRSHPAGVVVAALLLGFLSSRRPRGRRQWCPRKLIEMLQGRRRCSRSPRRRHDPRLRRRDRADGEKDHRAP